MNEARRRSEGGRRPTRAQEKTRERLEEEQTETKTDIDTERLGRQVETVALAHT
jgi:hypothetical protein